jgi:hypothetical protein
VLGRPLLRNEPQEPLGNVLDLLTPRCHTGL